MIFGRFFLRICAVVPVLALCLNASGQSATDKTREKDKDLAVLESQLQTGRAAAVRARLLLYTDELKKLETEYTAAGLSSPTATVQAELKFVEAATKRLTAIAGGTFEPAEPGELKPDEVLNDTALAARRIDLIIAHFTRARTEPVVADAGTAGKAAPRTLRIERAIKSREHAKLEGTAYWVYDNSYAAWPLDDLMPGDYEIVLRYSGSKSGGKATVKIGKQSFDVTVPYNEKGKIEPIAAGTVKITERGAEVRVESKGRHKDAAYLWNLQSLVLQPVGSRP